MKGNKPGERLRGGKRLARWRINLKINKTVMELRRRGPRGQLRRGEAILITRRVGEGRTRVPGWRKELERDERQRREQGSLGNPRLGDPGRGCLI